MSVASLLAAFADRSQTVSPSRLSELSGLEGEGLGEFRAALAGLEGDQRRRLVDWLADLAEDDVELSFANVYLELLADSDEHVRLRAVDGLWEHEGTEVVPTFIDLLRTDESETVRAAAALALGRHALRLELDEISIAAVPGLDGALISVARDESMPLTVRRRALEAVGARSLPAVQSTIKLANNDHRRELRLGALAAMGRSADDRWVGLLIGELGNDDPEFRYEALLALGEIESGEAVLDIIERLADEDDEVRLAAVGALGHIGGREAVNALTRISKGDDEVLADAATDALETAEFSERLF